MEKLYGSVLNFGLIHYEWTTGLFMLIVFFVVAFFLHIWLFKPIFAVVHKRDEAKRDLDKTLREARVSLSRAAKDLDAKEKLLKQEIQTLYQTKLAEGKEDASQILQQGKAEIEKQLSEFDAQINKEKQQAIDESKTYIEMLSQKVYTKIV